MRDKLENDEINRHRLVSKNNRLVCFVLCFLGHQRLPEFSLLASLQVNLCPSFFVIYRYSNKVYIKVMRTAIYSHGQSMFSGDKIAMNISLFVLLMMNSYLLK